MRLTVFLVLFSLFAVSAQAKLPDDEKSFLLKERELSRKVEQAETTKAMNEAQVAVEQYLRDELTNCDQMARRSFRGDLLKQYTESQEKWQAYRNSMRKLLESKFKDAQGSISGIQLSSYLQTLDRNRILEILTLLQGLQRAEK